MHGAADQDLALRAAAGDRGAFESLLVRQYDRIFRTAWRLVGQRADAEDIAQDVCVKLAYAIRSFRGEAEIATWLWRITYNAATDRLRARRRVSPVDPADMMALAEAPVAPDGDDAVEGRELWAAVRGLPDQQRDAVLLVYGEDMSHAEAAAILGCTEKTVSWHLHTARKRLRTIFEAAG